MMQLETETSGTHVAQKLAVPITHIIMRIEYLPLDLLDGSRTIEAYSAYETKPTPSKLYTPYANDPNITPPPIQTLLGTPSRSYPKSKRQPCQAQTTPKQPNPQSPS